MTQNTNEKQRAAEEARDAALYDAAVRDLQAALLPVLRKHGSRFTIAAASVAVGQMVAAAQIEGMLFASLDDFLPHVQEWVRAGAAQESAATIEAIVGARYDA